MGFLVENAEAGLFLDPGLGKTSIVLASFMLLQNLGYVNKLLVIAPLRVAQLVWPQEVEKWKEFENLRVAVLHGSKKEEALSANADVYVINPEGLEWLFSGDRFKRIGCDALCLDESSKFKHADTKRYKLLKKQLGKFDRRWILTGSPAANGLLDLFGQIYLLDFGRALGRYITHYRNEFFDPSGYGGYSWKPKPGAEPKIQQRIKHLVVRLKAEDYLELPALVTQNILVELPDKARKHYEELEEEMFLALSEGTVAATSSASVSVKCRQLTGGALYLDPRADETDGAIARNREWEEIHRVKIDALLDLLDERGGKPTLILYQFTHERERLCKALRAIAGGDVPFIGGGVAAAQSKKHCADWNAGRLPVLLGHPASMGHGLNLQEGEGDALVWFSPTWDYEMSDQTIRRLLRQGSQHKTIFNYQILARNTVDMAVVRANSTKGKNQTRFLDALRTYRSSRK